VSNIQIILTLDYEIHGNGFGEFYDYAYLPTNKLLDELDRFGAKLTIMAEMGHYWCMQQHSDFFKEDIQLFESQLKDAISRGHDVQFHFHPQWIGVEYDSINNVWPLSFDKNGISKLTKNYSQTLFYFKKGKEDLECLLKSINTEYECVAFRAGYFQIQPSQFIIQAMKETGFLSDSSVAIGMNIDDGLRKIDFTNAKSSFRPWQADKLSVERVGNSGIIEFPIFCSSSRLPKKLSKLYKPTHFSAVISNVIAPTYSIFHKKKINHKHESHIAFQNNTFNLTKSLFRKRYTQQDFLLSPPQELIKNIKKINRKLRKDLSTTPIILISHSKHFASPSNLRKILSFFREENIEVVNYRDALKPYSG